MGEERSGLHRRVVPTSAPLHVTEVSTEPPGGRETESFLFLHGYGSSSYMWRHWLHAFASRGRVLLVDMKGFGAAPKPDDDRYSPHDLAESVTAFIREHDVEPLTLVGQSLGGGIALLTALRLLDEGVGRLERMVLLAPAAYRQRPPPFVWLSHRPRLASSLIRLVGARRILRWTMRSVVYDPRSVTEDQVEEYSRPWRTPEGRRAALAAGRRIIPPDIERHTDRYGELDVPTLLLWGDSDRVVSLDVGRRLEHQMPDAHLVVIERCGHMATDEHPWTSLAVTERFLDEHRSFG